MPAKKGSREGDDLEQKRIKEFLPQLLKMPAVRRALKRQFGKNTDGIIKGLGKNPKLESAVEMIALEEIEDFVTSNGKEVETIFAQGDVVFAIRIIKMGPVFWVEATEFDPIRYFSSLEGAVSAAEFEFSSFIEAYRSKG